jgi:P63C domain
MLLPGSTSRSDDSGRDIIARLRGWKYTEKVKRPSYLGHLTNDLVYARLAPGVLEELRRANPVGEHGNRKSKHHQWLTEDLGHPKLLQHLSALVALMRASQTWDQFKTMVNMALPKHVKLPLFDARKPLSSRRLMTNQRSQFP